MAPRSSTVTRSGAAVAAEQRVAPALREHPDQVPLEDIRRDAWYSEAPDLLPERFGELLTLDPRKQPEHPDNAAVSQRRDRIMAALDMRHTNRDRARYLLGQALLDDLAADLGAQIDDIVDRKHNR